MNLSMDVLRWLTVKALRGRTWAEMRVYDSPGTPADLRVADERAPFIAVYTDDADFDLGGEQGVGVASLFDGGGTVFLVIEVSVAGQADEGPAQVTGDHDPTDPDMDQPPTPADQTILAATDEALEATIGFIARQVVTALTAPDNPWAQLWLKLTPERGKVEIRRGGSGQQDVQQAQRFASRVMRLTLGVLAEPVPGDLAGDKPTAFWPMFLAAAEGDQELGELAGLIRAHLAGTLPSWQRQQQALSLTDRGARGLGIGPAIQEVAETPATNSVTLTGGAQPFTVEQEP